MEIDVGKNIRLLRQEKGLSLRALAEASGLNVNTLSLIENGKSSPSVSTLRQLAEALQVPITSFFVTAQLPQRVVYQRANTRPHAIFSHGFVEDLGAGMTQPGMEAILIAIAAGGRSGENSITHGGRELVYCLSGKVDYSVENQVYPLLAGDSLMFEAAMPHAWHNPGSEQAQILLSLCPGDPKDQISRQHFESGGAGPLLP